MRKALIPVLFILMLTNSLVKAQTDQSTPTKEDAVSFLNKLIKTYPKFEDINLTLDGCVLKITNNKRSYNQYERKPDTQMDKEVISIDLSSVYFYNVGTIDFQLRPSYSNSIIENNHHEVLSYENSKVRSTYDEIPKSLSFIKVLDLLKNINEMPDDFRDKDYTNRYLKAFVFLVQSCGGGQLKSDPGEKF